jgi:DnaJ domain
MTEEQCYKILDLNAGVSAREVEKARITHLKAWHPDKFSNDAELKIANEKAKEINRAYEIILRSMNNPYDKPAVTQNYNQPQNSNPKKKIARILGITAISIIAAVIIACGAGAYFVNRFFNANSTNIVSSNTNRSIPIEDRLGTKTANFTFTPNVSMSFEDSRTNYKIQILETASFSTGKMTLKVSICNIGNTHGSQIKPSFWYTPLNGQNTIYLDNTTNDYATTRISLRPGACEVQERRGSADSSFRLARPFGKLNMGADFSSSILSSLDLNKIDSQGDIR